MKKTLLFIVLLIVLSSCKDASTYDKSEATKANLKDYGGAIQDYNKAIELNPEDANSYYNRGVAKYNLEDLEGACLDWSKAGELGYADVYDIIKEYCN